MTEAQATLVPPVGRPRPYRLPSVQERTLKGGMRVLAVRRRGVPMVELRMRVPLSRAGGRRDAAVEQMLAATLQSGTEGRSNIAIAEQLQRLGATFGAGAGEHLTVSGSVLAPNLTPFLDLARDVLMAPAFPAREVGVQRDRLAESLQIAHAQPDRIAQDAILGQLYRRHLYGRGTPAPGAVARVGPARLSRFHADHVGPNRAIAVVVGDLAPARMLDAVEAALGSWRRGPRAEVPPPPSPAPPDGIVVVHRPGAVQANLRLAGPAVDRSHPQFAALQVANTIFGGYFSSRLVANIREQRGYTYSPRSGVEHRQVASHVGVAADVATEVTAPALVEIDYELHRMVSSPVTDDELGSAQRYVVGSMALATQTQAGLASQLLTFVSAGLGVEHLRDHPKGVLAVTADAVLDAAACYLARRRMVAVVVGDADRIATRLEALAPVTVT